MFTPDWLKPLMGEREWAIANSPYAKCVHVDVDGNRLPPYQQIICRVKTVQSGAALIHIIDDNAGFFVIDSKRRQIIG